MKNSLNLCHDFEFLFSLIFTEATQNLGPPTKKITSRQKSDPPTKKMTPENWSMLSSDNYKNLDEIILNPTYNN